MSGVTLIGYGQLGRALAAALAARGEPGIRVWTRRPAALGGDSPAGVSFFTGDDLARAVAPSRLVVLAVGDGAVQEVVERLAGSGATWAGKVGLHASGVLPVAVLEPLARLGAHVGAVHPLRAFPVLPPGTGREATALFEGAPFTLEGAPQALEAARSLVLRLGGIALGSRVRDRAGYHLAATLASNYGLLLRDWAGRRFEASGLSAGDAARAADALVRNALDNALDSALGPGASPGAAGDGPDRPARTAGEAAPLPPHPTLPSGSLPHPTLPSGSLPHPTLPLTGPIRRGDLDTVRAHLGALSGGELLAYAALGLLLLGRLGWQEDLPRPDRLRARAGAPGSIDVPAARAMAELLHGALERGLAELHADPLFAGAR